MSIVGLLERHLQPGALVAVADGAGAPAGLGTALTDVAMARGDLSLLLGWCLRPPVECFRSFASVRAVMGGYALRKGINNGEITYLPVRLATVPALVSGPLRPDALLASLVPTRDGLSFGTEVAWMQAVVDAGVPVLAEVNDGLPSATAGGVVPADQTTVLSEVDRPPICQDVAIYDEDARTIGRRIAEMIPEGASLQYPPGAIGQAVVEALDVPVSITTGVVTDAVMGLEERGLLNGVPSCAYVVGTAQLYRWADGRELASRIEVTHDYGRLAALQSFVAVNVALEIDLTGQVNVEALGGDAIGGIGGHADFALAASHSKRGLSVIAVPTHHRGRSTLVERLATPTSTPRSDVDLVVTEQGTVDLRGLGDGERAQALGALWGK